jgi:CubicO group peptidase (beta-lactamase class C family)
MNAKLFIFFCLLFSFTGNAQVTYKESTATDSLVNDFIKKNKIPGMAIAILEKGHIIKLKGYGIADLESNTNVIADSRFKIASLSKQFISTAILLLQKEGKLNIDSSLFSYYTEIPASWQKITLRQLLNHTAGYKRDPDEYSSYSNIADSTIIKSTFDNGLINAPGEKFVYSNIGYYILAEIISRVTHLPWDQYISQNIFKPSGMNKTEVTNTKKLIYNRVKGYHRSNDTIENTEEWIAVRPSGAYLSTIEDMAKWDSILESNTLLTANDKTILWEAGTLNDGSKTIYGMGWYVEAFLSQKRIHHDGQYPGFRADYEKFPDLGLTIITLSNLDNNSLEPLSLQIARVWKSQLKFPTFKIVSTQQRIDSKIDQKISYNIAVTSADKESNNTVFELNIFNDKKEMVNKKVLSSLNFKPGETKNLSFDWTPDKPGKYILQAGTFGPRYVSRFIWKVSIMEFNISP